MKLDLIEEHIQNRLEVIASAAHTAEYLASSMRSENDIDWATLTGITAQGRKILDECERMKAICDALTYEKKEEDDER